MSRLELSKKETYLALIENSVGANFFKSAYFVTDEGEIKDILESGNLSCSFYVSTVLNILKIIDIHMTVNSTVKEIEESGNFSIVSGDLEPGDIILWDQTIESNGHTHLGFYVGNDEAISNSPSERKIIKHHYTFGDKRAIVKAFRPKFEK